MSMNASAERPEWLPIVKQCEAQYGSADGLPTLEADLGPGAWKAQIGRITEDGTVNVILYWRAGANWRVREHVRIGSFRLAADQAAAKPQRSNDQTGALTTGWTPTGERIMRTSTGAEIVVDFEQHRGERLPRPVPIELWRQCEPSPW
jgi:hypothetical protein